MISLSCGSKEWNHVKIEHKIDARFDLLMFITVLGLCVVGVLAIYSATQNSAFVNSHVQRQVLSLVLAVVVFFVAYSIPLRWLREITIPAYVFGLLLLLAVLAIGTLVGGQRSWIRIGGFSFQPAEFAKLTTIMAVALYLSRTNTNLDSLKDIFITLLLGMVPVVLILLEPDLGSSIVFIGIIISLMFWKGISLFGLFVVLSPGVVAVAALFGWVYMLIAFAMVVSILLWFRRDLFMSASILALNMASAFFVDYVYNLLSPHQQRRISSFIDPMADPRGAGYNAIQAQIAIGSGGLTGKGYLAGNQTQLQFIPEQWTDFIFCVIGEEFGFVGSVILLLLFSVLFFRILRVTNRTREEFHSLIVIGVLSTFIIHYAINIGMAIGIMPVIGIPLPFVSYGGTSLIVNMAMLGLVMNIYRSNRE